MRYAFPCDIVRDEEEEMATGREAYVVTFPDVPEAITGGWTWEGALEMAEDALSRCPELLRGRTPRYTNAQRCRQ